METPFVSGAKVAIQIDGGYGMPFGYKAGAVDKVYKTGRFTLVGSNQQWRPHQPGRWTKHWHATETGDHGWRGGGHLRIWDEEGDAEIKEAIASRNRYERFMKLQRDIEHLRYDSELVTDDALDQMQIIVLAIKPIKKDDAA